MEAVVIHALPGRTRLRVRAVLLSPERSVQLAEALTTIPGITKVEINSRSGSVLVWHDASLAAANVLALTSTTLESRHIEAQPPEPGETQGVTRVARALHRLFVDADRDLRIRTHGMLDLGTATTLTLLTAGAVEVAVTQKLPIPPWFNLAWWSFRTFMTTIEERAASEDQTSPPAPSAKGTEP